MKFPKKKRCRPRAAHDFDDVRSPAPHHHLTRLILLAASPYRWLILLTRASHLEEATATPNVGCVRWRSGSANGHLLKHQTSSSESTLFTLHQNGLKPLSGLVTVRSYQFRMRSDRTGQRWPVSNLPSQYPLAVQSTATLRQPLKCRSCTSKTVVPIRLIPPHCCHQVQKNSRTTLLIAAIRPERPLDGTTWADLPGFALACSSCLSAPFRIQSWTTHLISGIRPVAKL